MPPFVELPAASWYTYMGPPAKDRRFLTSLQPGTMPIHAGIRPCFMMMGPVLYNSLLHAVDLCELHCLRNL